MKRVCKTAVALIAGICLAACAQPFGAMRSSSGGMGAVADQMYFDDAKNVDLILFRCDGNYMSLESGSDRWSMVYDNVPDMLVINKGEFVSINADITRVSGGVAGYSGNPDIKKVHSVQPLTLVELVNNGVLKEYDPAKGSFYGLYSLSSDGGLYCIAGINGIYYVYTEETFIGAYGTPFEAEIAMGLHDKADISLSYEMVPGVSAYIFRCQDEYLLYCNSTLMNSDGLWKPLLNEDFENQPVGITLHDGEAAYIKNIDLYKVNGGSYVDAPMLIGAQDFETCHYDTITMHAVVGHWEEGADGREGELNQYHSGEYLIFFQNGAYSVYRDEGKQQTFIGSYDTPQAVDDVIRPVSP